MRCAPGRHRIRTRRFLAVLGEIAAAIRQLPHRAVVAHVHTDARTGRDIQRRLRACAAARCARTLRGRSGPLLQTRRDERDHRQSASRREGRRHPVCRPLPTGRAAPDRQEADLAAARGCVARSARGRADTADAPAERRAEYRASTTAMTPRDSSHRMARDARASGRRCLPGRAVLPLRARTASAPIAGSAFPASSPGKACCAPRCDAREAFPAWRAGNDSRDRAAGTSHDVTGNRQPLPAATLGATVSRMGILRSDAVPERTDAGIVDLQTSGRYFYSLTGHVYVGEMAG